MQKIFVFVDHYVPGYRFGGQLRAIANMVTRLAPHFDFYIFTSDRDHGDPNPYDNIAREQWTAVGAAMVFYTSDRSLKNILRQISEISPDVVYLNSFFSRITVKVLVARSLGLFPEVPLLVAPRGEFSEGALMIKPWRKKLFIVLVNSLGLLNELPLQASTHLEREDVARQLGNKRRPQRVLVASEFASADSVGPLHRTSKRRGVLRLIFLSRISRKKNLIGAIQMLHGLSGEISFSIYGPVGDPEYWKACERSIRSLPANAKVEYRGAVKHEQVEDVFSRHDLLLLPTHGENYGHVIIESFKAGCPVLISDQTPWKNLEERGVGADIPLERTDRFEQMLQRFVAMDDEEYQQWSERARQYGEECARNEAPIQQTIEMFSKLIAKGEKGKAMSAKIS